MKYKVIIHVQSNTWEIIEVESGKKIHTKTVTVTVPFDYQQDVSKPYEPSRLQAIVDNGITLDDVECEYIDD